MPSPILVTSFVLCAAFGTGVRAVLTMHEGPARQRAGTLFVNLVGAFVLGALSELEGNSNIVVGVALIGSLTTFSSLVSQVIEAWDCGERQTAVRYLALSIIGGLASAWTGIQFSGVI